MMLLRDQNGKSPIVGKKNALLLGLDCLGCIPVLVEEKLTMTGRVKIHALELF
jgi:hypothetical protein